MQIKSLNFFIHLTKQFDMLLSSEITFISNKIFFLFIYVLFSQTNLLIYSMYGHFFYLQQQYLYKFEGIVLSDRFNNI